MRYPAAACLLALWPTVLQGHDTAHQVQDTRAMPLETLALSNIPVTDKRSETRGFVDRFGTAGTILLSFTYTGCETLCPVTNAILAEVDHRVGADALTIVSVSIDPERDTPDALARMADDLEASDNWVWLTAAPRENRMLLQELGVDVATLEEHDPVFLIGDLCSGRFTRIIGLPEPSALIDLARQHPQCGS